MFESIGRSIELVKTSWTILMDDKKLLIFPILSGLVTLLVLLTFALPFLFAGMVMGLAIAGSGIFFLILFAFYVVSYFIVIFFNTALISCVNARLNGTGMSVGEGLTHASRHLPSIFAWALISATIGLILHLIERRAGILGRIAGAVIGGVWSLLTFFVVPVLVLEDKGVLDSVKESVSLIKRTWGESIVGSGSILLIFVATGFIAFLALLGALAFGNMIVFGTALALFLILIVVLVVVASAMQGIFVTALYTYARTGSVPAAFSRDLIEHAFVPRQAGPGTI